MRFIYSLIYAVLIFSVTSSAFNLKGPWLKPNSGGDSVSVAVRSYENPKNRKIITIVGMFHIADASFYREVEKIFRGKPVIYETMGTNWNFTRDFNREIAKLNPTQRLAFFKIDDDFMRLIALSLGLSYQNDEIDYSKSLKYFHADVSDDEKKIEPSRKEFPFVENISDVLKELVDRRYKMKFPAGKIDNIADKASAVFQKQIEGIPKEVASKKGLVAANLSMSEAPTAMQVDERNQLINQKIKDVLTQYDEVVVTYGASHLAAIEDMIVKQGFRPIDDGEKWLIVF